MRGRKRKGRGGGRRRERRGDEMGTGEEGVSLRPPGSTVPQKGPNPGPPGPQPSPAYGRGPLLPSKSCTFQA